MNTHNYWTEEEIAYLEKYWGRTEPKKIAKKLNRKPQSIYDKARRLGLGNCKDNIDGIPIGMLPDIIGVTHRNIHKTWIENNKLKVYKAGGNFSYVKEKDLVKFMKTHPHLWRATECDYYYFYTHKWFLEKLESERNKEYQPKMFKAWTEYEDNQLIIGRKRGKTFQEIGNSIGKTKQSCVRRYHYLFGDNGSRVLWKPEEIEKLLDLRSKGVAYSKISKEIGRSNGACRNKYQYLMKGETECLNENVDGVVKVS